MKPRDRAKHVADFAQQRVFVTDLPAQVPDHVQVRCPEGCPVEFFLVTEMVVDTGLFQSGFIADFANRGSVKPLAGECNCCTHQDTLPGIFPWVILPCWFAFLGFHVANGRAHSLTGRANEK